jgi:hypothetical protein
VHNFSRRAKSPTTCPPGCYSLPHRDLRQPDRYFRGTGRAPHKCAKNRCNPLSRFRMRPIQREFWDLRIGGLLVHIFAHILLMARNGSIPTRSASEGVPGRPRWRFGLARIIQVGCVKLAQVQGASAQAAFGADDTPSTTERPPCERRRTVARACSTHPTLKRE